MCFQISIHALLAESDLLPLILAAANLNFYPRSPCGERLGYTVNFHAETGISIHALLAESDLKTPCVKLSIDVFLSTLSLRRATIVARAGNRAIGISIHALLAESDT